VTSRRARLVLACSLLGACATLEETHYFASVDPQTDRTINIFRLRVKGDAGLTNARYLAGYYDERAVDLFFNEVKASDLSSDAKYGASSFFKTDLCAASDTAD